jgi:D-alanyl-D-alanine carboxypeptidase
MQNITRLITGLQIGILYLVLLSCSCNETPVNDRLQEVLDKEIKRHKVKGVTASVIFPDGSTWIGVSGISHDTIAMKPDMVFAIGSITKNFVAALILKLAETGDLSLNDPVSKYLPGYEHINGNISIRQLLNHTSGIYMFWSNQEIWDDLKKDRYKVWEPEEVLKYLKEPYFAPGEGFRYSNTNYLLLAMIIEKVKGSSLSSEFRKHFWQPLNIDQAYLSIQETIPDHQIHVFGDNFNDDGSTLDLTFLPRASHESITFGSSGLFMTAQDLAFWCHSLFAGKVLSQQSLSEMLKLVPVRSGGNMDGYGLGVQSYTKKITHGVRSYGHSGANIGTSAYMVYLPDYQITIAIAINDMNHRCTESMVRKLTGILIKKY